MLTLTSPHVGDYPWLFQTWLQRGEQGVWVGVTLVGARCCCWRRLVPGYRLVTETEELASQGSCQG